MQQINRREALRRVALLLGGAVSAPSIAGVMGGCRAASDWTPAVLTADQNELISVIADRLIPGGDSPGASDVGVNRFIDRMLAEWYPDTFRTSFLDGVADLERRQFLNLDEEQQSEMLSILDREAFPDPAKPPEVRERMGGPGDTQTDESADPYGAADSVAVSGARDPVHRLSTEMSEKVRSVVEAAKERVRAKRADGGPFIRADVAHEASTLGDPPPFMRLMKELTLLGYYTSEVGATQELRYEAVPGRFEPCIPFNEIGKTWSV